MIINFLRYYPKLIKILNLIDQGPFVAGHLQNDPDMCKINNIFIPEYYRRFALPVLAWAIFIFYEQLIVYRSLGKLSGLSVNLLYYGFNIAIFYIQRAILNKYITPVRPRYVFVGLFTVLLLLIAVSVKAAINLATSRSLLTWHQLFTLLTLDLARCVLFAGLATLVWVTAHIEIFRREAEQSRLVAARDKAEMESRLAQVRSAYYQHQLNPHLLFNTLNFIYNDLDQRESEAAKGILLLSDILRFSLADPDSSDKVLLADELDQLNKLFEINRLRYAGQLSVTYQLKGDPGTFRVIPLILLTLTENLFKHGLVNDPAKPASLFIEVSGEGQLRYQAINYFKHQAPDGTSGRIGLRNVRLRLDQAYPSGYALVADSEGEIFKVELKLQL